MIIVTGGSGKVGRACVRDLMEHGYDVTSIDMLPPPGQTNPPTSGNVRYSRADVTDFGQAMAALSMIDERVEKVTGVVHLAAIPAPGQATNHVTFTVNTVSTYNIFEAARQLGIRNVVWASSETVYGIPYAKGPAYVPVDEEIQRPETAYSLSKMVGEEMAKQFCRWDAKLKIIGLRFSNVMEPQDYERFPTFDADPRSRHWNLWTYIDARDAAQAIRLALESNLKGAEVFGIANADSVMSRANEDLLNEVYPKAKRKTAFGKNDSLISIEKARRVLGYEPQYAWRKQVAGKKGKK
jgi:nucleoside-diphosphate-sugar epimerase